MVLSVAGDQVSGRICEQFDRDCAPIDAGNYRNYTLNFAYRFKDGASMGMFQLSPQGSLVGQFYGSKNGRPVPPVAKTLYRVL